MHFCLRVGLIFVRIEFIGTSHYHLEWMQSVKDFNRVSMFS